MNEEHTYPSAIDLVAMMQSIKEKLDSTVSEINQSVDGKLESAIAELHQRVDEVTAAQSQQREENNSIPRQRQREISSSRTQQSLGGQTSR